MVCGPHCNDCPQQPIGNKFIPPSGTGSSGMMLVADSPWIDEIRLGYPFAGAAGSMLDRMLKRAGIDRHTLTIVNTIQCQPPRLGWMDNSHKIPEAAAAINHCRPHLDELIAQRQPRVIVPMGNVALERVCGVRGIEERQAYYHPTQGYGCWAIPTFHPSNILQGNQKFVPAFLFALRRAKEAAEGIGLDHFNLILDPSPMDLEAYIDSLPEHLEYIVLDIETPESSSLDEDELEESGVSFNIVRAGFCARETEGVSFPWTPPYIPLLQKVIDRAGFIVEWATNHFDSRRLRAHGITIPPEKSVSGMWQWHFLHSDLPKGLGKVAPFFMRLEPWKHLSSAQPAYYNAMDQAVPFTIWKKCEEALRREGRWDAYRRHILDMEGPFAEMHSAGILIDTVAQDKLKGELEEDYKVEVSKIQPLIPESILKEKLWKRPPKDMQGVQSRIIDCFVCDATGLQEGGTKPCKTCKATGKVTEYFKKLPFNPHGSAPDTKNLARHLGLKLPKSRETGDDTAQEKHLKVFARKFPIFLDILRARKISKMGSAYIWPTDSQGRIHTTFGFHPSTLRKSSRSPALQTIPKRDPILAARVRRTIKSSPGHRLLTADSAAIEAVLTGYWAKSKPLMRLSTAGIHDWLLAKKLGQPIPLDIPDDELRARCKAAKKLNPVLREMCKRVIHMSNYLATPNRILEEYPDDFKSLKEARELQDFYLDTEPGQDLRRWHKQTCDEASYHTYLDNSFGYRHYFFDVYTFSYSRYRSLKSKGMCDADARSGAWTWGDDAKRAIAFRPQSDASAIQTLIVLWLREHYPEIAQWLRLLIHDELVFDMPEALIEPSVPIVKEAMEQPWPQLQGLRIGCEMKVGLNLADMEVIA